MKIWQGNFRTILLVAATMLAGCVDPNPQAAFDDMGQTVAQRSGQPVRWMRDAAADKEAAASVSKLLEADLSAQSAVAIALLNNRSLQAEFEEIGISQAELAQASRLKNPEIVGLWRFPSSPPSATDAEYSIAADFLNLLTMPARKNIATQELEQVKLRVANDVLALAAEVQTAFYTVQARQQLVANLETVVEVNAAAADLARRQYDAGNIPDLALHNQQAALAQVRLEFAQARVQVRMDQERLNRLLGLQKEETNWKITGEMPPLPANEPPLDDLESRALAQRLDLAARYSETRSFAAALHLKENTRWIPGFTIGVDTERQTDGQSITGPFVGLELPIFDQGQPALAKLAAQYRQAERRYEALAVDIHSQVRDACDALSLARETAGFYHDVLLPQRTQILQETLLQYNAMQMSNYELLAAKQNEQAAEQGYIEALRDYWIARAELERVVGGRLGDAPPAATPPVQVAGVQSPAHP